MAPLLLGITLITFIVLHVAPGEPVEMQVSMNPKMTAEARERLKKYYGLDRPLYVQYAEWVYRLAKLDFGKSFSSDNRPVIDKIKERIPVTVSISIIALFLEFAIAIPIGILAATNRDQIWDKGVTVFVFLGFSIPIFWLALMLMQIFGVNLNLVPISGLHSMESDRFSKVQYILDMGKHLLLPLAVATFGSLAGLSRYMRSGMLEVLRQDYITTARAKGLKERVVIYRHALRNALLPVITFVGFSIPGLIGGSVIIEQIFSIPGMGRLFYDAIMARDYPVIMGVLVITAFLTLLGNMIADILYAIADPRIRHGKA